MQRKRQEETRAAKRRQYEKGGWLKLEIGEIRDEWWGTGGYIGKDGELEMGGWECKTGREERGGIGWGCVEKERWAAEGKAGRGVEERRSRGQEKGVGWRREVFGERLRCAWLENGGSSEAAQQSEAARLRSVWHWTAHDRRRLFSVIVTCNLIAKRERGDVRAI